MQEVTGSWLRAGARFWQHPALVAQLHRIREQVYQRRRQFALLMYGTFTASSFGVAFLLRFEFAPPPAIVSLYLTTVLPLVAIRLVCYRAFGLTRERWRYASARDAARLAAATALGSLIIVLLDWLLPLPAAVPLSVVAIEGGLTCGLTAGAWVAYRLGLEYYSAFPGTLGSQRKRVVIVGAGEAGSLLARELFKAPRRYAVVAYVDDNPFMWGAWLHGVEVIGGSADLARITASVHATEIIIAVPSAKPADLRRIVGYCEAAGVPYRVLPPMREVLEGDVRLNQLRQVRIEDLLGREPIQLELPELAADLCGRSVLITGAAGSIGSELSRQVALHEPSRLVLFDQAESDLFYLDLELRAAHPYLDIVTLVGDIVDGSAVERVFRTFRPERVFHAAAYKHVPMMEWNAGEAIRNNVLGTWRVADAAGRYGAGRFVLVSTDKAVRPANVMGATKRLAELIVLELQGEYPDTVFGAVRFGNVMGSNGSVIAVFKRQIEQGKPLTVTDPGVTRYFMTIPEAVQLILQSSLLDEFRGRVAMLDMGEPVRITDLAINLLRLSGIHDHASRIVFTGLRPGEKMHEELTSPDELAVTTSHPKVRVLQTPSDVEDLGRLVSSWEHLFRSDREQDVLAELWEIFPDLRRDLPARQPQYRTPEQTVGNTAIAR